jgi:hypothetical protein
MNNENQSTTPSISPNKLKILRAVVLQRINSTVEKLEKQTADLQTLDKQILILNGSVIKEPSIAGGEIKVPNNDSETGASN